MCHQGERFYQRLSYQQAVKRIAVMAGQFSGCHGVSYSDGEFVEPVGLNHLSKIVGSVEFPHRFFD